MKFSIKHYWNPTPKRIRKIADGVLAMSTFITTSSIIADWHKVALAAVLLGAGAKFLSNCFSEESNDGKPDK